MRQDLGTIGFTPGQEVRRFLAVPEGATWGELRLQAASQHDTPRRAQASGLRVPGF